MLLRLPATVLAILALGVLPPASARAAAGVSAELATGHADIAPALVDGVWVIRVKDDSAEPAVWRDPGEVVLRVGDGARTTLPAAAHYGFLGKAGDPVYLLPQTRMPGVLWLGFNTRHDSVLSGGFQDISLSLRDIDGPGTVHVYFDYGGFRAPQILWDGTAGHREHVVEPGVHAHANWAFSAPGEYRARFSASLRRADGTAAAATSTLRFVVGTPGAEAPRQIEPSVHLIAAAGALLLVLSATTVLILRRRRRRPKTEPVVTGRAEA
ncbi:choice-of-anchor M domain-containing protein [Actinoplanes utahensis]|uniref:choice-of-anchor M domain-containing protein n=1 Tax=Actinoplanes utahensis TaxID=1869 RepID=UPI000692062F|nr:choice-of-anchor M domain-containing protein [Actinoplanes utahensis]GIF32546.1 hypothetical protein Aut01nite_55320 [Actinoplanes utahensis]